MLLPSSSQLVSSYLPIPSKSDPTLSSFISRCKERLERQRKEETDMDYLRSHELQTKALWDQYSVPFPLSSPSLEPLRGVVAVRSRSSDFLLRFEFWKSRNRLGFAPHRLFRRRGPSLERRYDRSSLFVESSRWPRVLCQLEPDLDITSRSRRSRQPKRHTRFRNVLAGQFSLPFSLP